MQPLSLASCFCVGVAFEMHSRVSSPGSVISWPPRNLRPALYFGARSRMDGHLEASNIWMCGRAARRRRPGESEMTYCRVERATLSVHGYLSCLLFLRANFSGLAARRRLCGVTPCKKKPQQVACIVIGLGDLDVSAVGKCQFFLFTPGIVMSSKIVCERADRNWGKLGKTSNLMLFPAVEPRRSGKFTNKLFILLLLSPRSQESVLACQLFY